MAGLLYFGDPTSGYFQNPHAPDVNNAAIVPPPGVLIKNTTYPITVTIQNHGDLPVTDAKFQLFWSDVGTSYLPNYCCRIKLLQSQNIEARTDVEGMGTPKVLQINWTPSGCVVDQNGGYVALLALVSSVQTGQYPSVPTDTNNVSAVHNVQVVTSALTASSSSLVGATRGATKRGSGKPRAHEYSFAFAATNPTAETLMTEVVAIDLGSDKRPEQLASALCTPRLQRYIRGSKVQSPKPDNMTLHLGVERVLARYVDLGRKGEPEYAFQASRLGHTGVITPEIFERVVSRNDKSTPDHLELLPFESRQVILGVSPRGKHGDVHTIEIQHRTVKDKRPLGRMVVVYVVGEGFDG